MRFACMATLFPASAMALAMDSVDALVNHYGVDAAVWRAFINRCGDPGQDIRMIGALPPQVIAAACAAAEVAPGQSLTAIQASQIGLVYRLARRILHTRSGGSWEEWEDVDPWAQPSSSRGTSVTSSVAPPAPPSTKERKLKMSQVLDQGEDTEFTVEPESMRASWIQRVMAITGGYPQPEEEPTLEQLSALYQRTSIRDMGPYADFGVFVPFGSKALKASKFRTYVLTAEGYTTKELQGPANFIQWKACFKVYAMALLMLNIADQAVLHAYEAFVERLVRSYPTAWHLIYAAEDQARNGQATRMRMMINMEIKDGGSPPKGWEPSRPWNTVLRRLPGEAEYWRDQVHNPALTWLAHGARGQPKTPVELYATGHLKEGLEAVHPAMEEGGSGLDTPKKASNRARREARKRRLASEKEELEKYRRHGAEKKGGKGNGGKGNEGKGQAPKCFGWNNGNGPCASLAPGQECVSKVKREHRCTICNSPGHPSRSCDQKKQ